MGEGWAGGPGCILLIAAGLAACEAAPDEVASDGRIQNDLRAPSTLALTEVWRVGADDGVELFQVRDIARTDSDSWHLLDSGNSRVLRLTEDGQLLGEFGRRGEGPGEFIYGISLAATADTVMVTDDGQRVHFFSPEGELMATHLLEFEERAFLGIGIHSEGEWIVMAEGSTPRYGPDGEVLGAQNSTRTFRVDAATGTAEATGLNWIRPTTVEGEPAFAPLVDPGPVVGLRGDGRALFSESDRYAVAVYTFEGADDGMVASTIEERTVDDALITLWRENSPCPPEMLASGQCQPIPGVVPQSRGRRRPAVGSLRGFVSGHFAVRRADLDPNPYAAPPSFVHDYYAPDGRYLGTTDERTPLWFDGATLVALERDALDRESVAMYRVTIPE